ncbi:ATPase [Actinomycetospora sp. NBRC 106375]|uniref:AAA family ATPase n=1 Tax=Actinomycetospora sp. NBRC 106375 TaxID=3032207 RepID=UPI0024A27782|nr:ATP-binding protein [Actinomycetospora sp. NBRC 106375]GLZ48190.1 ATPase [Actinomycetospora sp. NBRC 106375]
MSSDAAEDPRVCLAAELGVLRARLRTLARAASPAEADDADAADDADDAGDAGDAGDAEDVEIADARAALTAAEGRRRGPGPLDLLAEGFGLSGFERAVLLLAAGPELVAAVRDELEAVSGRAQPSFGLALRLLPDAHWDAVTPVAPLRRWRLLRLTEPAFPTHSPLVVEERVLHHLVGAGHLDADLAALTRAVAGPAWLPGLLDAAAGEVARTWRRERTVLLHGPQPPNREAVAARAAVRSGLRLRWMGAEDIPADPAARDGLMRLMERETVLDGCAWAVHLARAEDIHWVPRAFRTLDAPLVLLGDGLEVPPAAAAHVVPVAVPRLDRGQRRALWARTLGRWDVGEDVVSTEERDRAADVFDLDLEAVEDAAADLALPAAATNPGNGRGEARGDARHDRLWSACRRAGRGSFAGWARVVVPRAGWDDLVLAEPQRAQLRALVAALRHRHTVLDDWGFGARTRGLGTTALFTGPSGTGKTLAGEVVAGAVGLDLVQVDLSQVLSKYIGETEKNLARLFDAAEDAAAVLLFDEADALFGRRSEVRDSHDRYANLEVGYLLQRMEEFRGLAVLTTNDRAALDPAFLRRLHVVVTFPYPDLPTRRELWRVGVPPTVPTHDVDPDRLAEIDLPGGGIAAAALTAAYLAAEDGGPMRAEHLRRATRWELAKSGRVSPPLPGGRRVP